MLLFFFYHGATAPSGPRPPHCRGFTITLRHTTSGRVISPKHRPLPDNTQHSQDIRATGGIRTRNPRKGAPADPRLKVVLNMNHNNNQYTRFILRPHEDAHLKTEVLRNVTFGRWSGCSQHVEGTLCHRLHGLAVQEEFYSLEDITHTLALTPM